MSFPGWTAALALVLVAAAGCAVPPQTCGTPRPEGGPPRIETREQELCENVRLGVLRFFHDYEGLTDEQAEQLSRDRRSWASAESVAALLKRLERDFDADLAALVERHVRWAETRSELPLADPSNPDRSLAKGAGHGAYLAAGVAYQMVDFVPQGTESAQPGKAPAEPLDPDIFDD